MCVAFTKVVTMRVALLLALQAALLCCVHTEIHWHMAKTSTTQGTLSTELLATTTTAREDVEAEQLELAMSEVRSDKRFQDAERRRVSLFLSNEEAEFDGIELTTGPCLYMQCSAGRACELDERGAAACACVRSCGGGARVCSTRNETWRSACALHRARCLCQEDAAQCADLRHQHAQLHYYGECRHVSECTVKQMKEYPRLMRDWVLGALRELAARGRRAPAYLAMKHEARADLTRRWHYAAIWKWCYTDALYNERSVSVHELCPFCGSLGLDHCTAPFLDYCDQDNDHRITLAEWAACLELHENELDERCHEMMTNPVVGVDY